MPHNVDHTTWTTNSPIVFFKAINTINLHKLAGASRRGRARTASGRRVGSGGGIDGNGGGSVAVERWQQKLWYEN